MFGDFMGNVYITLDEEHEIFLRQQVQENMDLKRLNKYSYTTSFGRTKGKRKRTDSKTIFQTIDKGINLGFKGKAYTSRDEIYD